MLFGRSISEVFAKLQQETGLKKLTPYPEKYGTNSIAIERYNPRIRDLIPLTGN